MQTVLRSLALALAAIVAFAQTADAQTYPSKIITLIVNTGPGGITDLVGRVFGDYLVKKGHQAVILNRAGAGGNIGTAALAQAKPDGYTLGTAAASTMVINPFLYKSMGFDPFKDVVPVAPLGENTQTLVINAKLPVNSVQEFVQYVKDHPDTVSYGSPGLGSNNHLAAEQFARSAGIKMVHVPFKGGAESFTALLANTVQMMMVGPGITVPHVKAGTIRMLAVAAPKRLSYLPDVPTITEAGVPGVEMTIWFGLLAPKGTPDAIVQQLNTWAHESVLEPSAKIKLDANMVTPMRETPAEFANRISSEAKIWERVVKEVGISLN